MKEPIDIAVGYGANSRIWKNKKITWSEFTKKLSKAVVTEETIKEYLAASKQDQSKIKDVGGYVGGYLRNGRRKPESVLHRQILTLDVDFAHLHFWDDFCLQFGNTALIHSTHKHTYDDPRFRLLIPLSREVSPDEYVAVARKIAGILGIDLFDNTTFETNRLMFWPSVSKDVEYYFRKQDGPLLDADVILDLYTDWTDSSCWPTAEKKKQEIHLAAKKQEDPDFKRGLIGYFCRTYGITKAIDTFLREVYKPADNSRFTYIKGTAAAGLVTYDDKFSYSHHGTDPTSGLLCNSFDLVRIHLFGHLDMASDNQRKSVVAMEELAKRDDAVKKTIATEKFTESKYDFSAEVGIELPEETEEDKEWVTELEIDGRGKYLASAGNISLIFANDSHIKNKFKLNTFDAKAYACGNLPWRKIKSQEPIKNVDYSGLRNYIESIYGIAGTLKIDDVLNLELEKHSYHPIVEYLKGLTWDGVDRLDTLLINYFGAEDNIYSREAIRKPLCAAVARVFQPGTKFDLVLTLVSEQGTFKSTFFSKLGKQWFSDTFMTVQGKEALEQIQGAWLIEMAELAGLRKAEVEAIKHFISKQEDMFRPAYGRTVETYKRQCIFFGTTNNKDFLRDPTGNRRFMPIDVRPAFVTRDVRKMSDSEVDQIWAEALVLYRLNEKLYLSEPAEKLAKLEQHAHSEFDERTGVIQEYLNMLLPKNWDDLGLLERRLFIDGDLTERGSVQRDYACVAEIWCECLGKDKKDMSRYNTRDINDIMKSLTDWTGVNSTKNFKLYGKQKYYVRNLD